MVLLKKGFFTPTIRKVGYMKMAQKKFRIGELAKRLSVEQFVIRFWEKEFEIKHQRKKGTQRFYYEEDLHIFAQIKNLLYLEGFTIAGAKQQLACHITKRTVVSPSKLEGSYTCLKEREQHTLINHKWKLLKDQLLNLRKLL